MLRHPPRRPERRPLCFTEAEPAPIGHNKLPEPTPVAEDSLVKAMKISRALLEGSPRGPLASLVEMPAFVGWRVAQPPPGVPESVKIASDEAMAPIYGYGGQGLGDGFFFPGYPFLAELAQRPEFRRISDVYAKEMTRKWITLESSGDDDKSEKIAQIEAALKRFKVQALFRQAALSDGLYGRGQLFFDLGDEQGEEIKTPIAKRDGTILKGKVAKGSLRAIRHVEPMWSYPGLYNSTNPLAADYFNPTTWYVMGNEVHRSRLLTFVGRPVSDILKASYAFGGLSRTQMAIPYVNNFIRTRQSVSDLLHSFSIVVLATNLAATLDAGGAEEIQKRAQMAILLRDNRGLQIIDKETEDLKNLAVPLGTLDHLQAQSQEQISSIAAIPLVKYLGITPSGLNASSDGEIRVFYDSVHSEQEDLFLDNLKIVLDVIQLNEFGVIDPDITATFEPLWQLDEAAKASVRKTDADTAAVYIETGVIDRDEERQRLANEKDNPYHGLEGPAPEQPEDDDEYEPGISGDPAKGAEPKREERSGV